VNDVKHWWQSKTVLGGLVALLSSLLGLNFDISLSQADQECLTEALVNSEMLDRVFQGVSALGGLAAVYGRLTADKKISKPRSKR
jgi:hypothetical protein